MMNMKPTTLMASRMRQRGQTIIIALVVLGILLILGIVFLGIIDKNSKTSYNMGNRSAANDLSEAGIRYAHAQLLASQLGADWRGTPATFDDPTVSTDPDLLYLRPAAHFNGGGGIPFIPGSQQLDLGGPDGLGSYFRVRYSNGRSLVRVRYAPSDANIFSSSPVGPLRQPGLARNYIIIESVGREGIVSLSDPTTQNSASPIQYQSFSDDASFRTALGQMQQSESRYPFSQVNRAFVSIGIIESARFISNKYNVSRAADIGVPYETGAMYGGVPVAGNLTYQLGSAQPMFNLGSIPTPAGPIEQGGSIFSNASVVIHGNVTLDLNRFLGDQFDVAGSVKGDSQNGAYNGGQLNIVLRDLVQGGTTWAAAGPAANLNELNGGLDSQSGAFSTVRGVFRDGSSQPDGLGYPRGVGGKGVPSMELTDPDTGENRYVLMSAGSGVQIGNGNTGLYGHGAGVYVYNPSDIQTPADEAGRQNIGTQASLIYDWLNPNNGEMNSGWQGYLYIPMGSLFEGLDDGFTIQRSAMANVPQAEKNWHYADGTDTGNPFIRYRIGLGTDGQRHIVNSFTPSSVGNPTNPINISANLGPTDFDKGPVFNGVIYFAGNARVKGIIPTDVQITLVSNATIYVEGSILKGIRSNGLQVGEGYSLGQMITRPSKSMMMLMAKDYVAVNTTQFVAPAPNQAITPFADAPNSNGFNAIQADPNNPIAFDFDFARDPNGPTATANNPSTTRPYEFDYAEYGSSSTKIPTSVLIAHTMANGAANNTFFTWDLNYGAGGSTQYMFARTDNAASAFIPGVTTTIPEYGLGEETYQRYSLFEQTSFPLIDSSTATVSSDGQSIVASGNTGTYSLFTQGLNELLVRPIQLDSVPTNTYMVGRLALAPHDIQIQASMYAEEGSFFVIPGPWFNPDPNDTREAYLGSVKIEVQTAQALKAERDAIRLENFGASPVMPFYGEPLDVRVVISGAVSENMPPPASVQAEWIKKWGWIPGDFAATGFVIPGSHVPAGYTVNANSGNIVPNLIFTYDPALSTARSSGFVTDNSTSTLIRTDSYGRPLPPLPRLPVSPVLAYFGEVH